jgi:hypothetical protein
MEGSAKSDRRVSKRLLAPCGVRVFGEATRPLHSTLRRKRLSSVPRVYAKDDYRSIIYRSVIQYSQIELRIVAKISGDKEILSAYADENQDLHTLTARGLTC